jgi:hypothetical protein
LSVVICQNSLYPSQKKKTAPSTNTSKRDGTLIGTEKLHDEGDTNSNTNNRNDTESVRGRILRRQTATSSPTEANDDANSTSNVATTTSSRKREATVSPDSSNSNIITGLDTNQDIDGISNNKSKKARKTVTFDGNTEMNAASVNSESDNAKRLRTAAQLAREQRSRRRQAAQGMDGSDHTSVMASQRKPDNRTNHKKKVLGSTSTNAETDTNVVRVPMLTGTLMLYRGAHPRAVFVRRV